MYRIGLFSKMNQVTIKTLRHYDETGLLKPAYIDETNGYRYYSSNQLPIVHTILALKQMGFSRRSYPLWRVILQENRFLRSIM